MKHKFQTTITLALLLLIAVPLSAQRERVRTVTATGSYVANQNETPAYGWSKALLEAKKQALREAGVMEDISSTTIMVMGGAENDFREISSELGRIEIEGRVRVEEQTNASPVFTNDGLIRYTTTIRADVLMEETEDDMLFQFKTDGLKNIYRDGEKMTFTITPMADCYLRIFYFGEIPSSNAQIYPIDSLLKDVQLKANVPVQFPPSKKNRQFFYNRKDYNYVDYDIGIDDKRNNLEQGVLLIVALKKPYPFMEEVSYESVISWLSRIKRNEKRVQWHGVNIVRD
ncbi:MAG: DUF4384 domain-containing protein [Bacteroidales bacterium]|nr:DUF4384 domain-containing protein [Bacteroidales bacterium]